MSMNENWERKVMARTNLNQSLREKRGRKEVRREKQLMPQIVCKRKELISSGRNQVKVK